MAMVNISLDTNTRQIALLVDGELKPMAEVRLDYFFDMDGEKVINFHYTMDVVNQQGLKEKHIFILPRPEDDEASIGSDGMISRKAIDSPSIAKDIHKYFERK